MYDYVVQELPALIEAHFPVTAERSISGHSMGGHGALVIALRNPGRYRSVSAFSPIVAPTQVPWGHKAFEAYLGSDREVWKQYDTVELIRTVQERLPLLVDQGLGDEFLERDGKSVVEVKSVSVRVDRGGRRIIQKKTKQYKQQ